MTSGLVLICDDDALLTELLEHRLGQQGYATAIVRDGAAALAFLAETRPDAVITKLMLPIVEGRELIRRIRADARLAGLPVIVLSQRRRDRDIVEALALGASDYVTKPFIPDELLARLARLIGSRAA
jgi:DNA-binding response OmpR family regulator